MTGLRCSRTWHFIIYSSNWSGVRHQNTYPFGNTQLKTILLTIQFSICFTRGPSQRKVRPRRSLNWMATNAVSLAFGPHSFASTVNDTVRAGRPVALCVLHHSEALNAKQRSSVYLFLSLWHNSIGALNGNIPHTSRAPYSQDMNLAQG